MLNRRENNMTTTARIFLAREIMLDFSKITGLEPETTHPDRYLWTDSFAVCNYLGLFDVTGERRYLNLGLRLVNQVHNTLGRHRADDPRKGWISGLSETEGGKHPVSGGLRIGKPMSERKSGEALDDQLEWDRDGQYYHYLTKWMHALNRVSRVTRDPVYIEWAIELARTAQEKFSYVPVSGQVKRMYWKMSIDLTYPQVMSMGQHDPLDGFITYQNLQKSAAMDFGLVLHPGLEREIADVRTICDSGNLVTDDPLGIGGLLFDATRIGDLIVNYNSRLSGLLESVLCSALQGVGFFSESRYLQLPAQSRLAFRELGLSIGLRGIEYLNELIGKNLEKFTKVHRRYTQSLAEYIPLAETIEQFWMKDRNRETDTWINHQEINMVMLATSLVPTGFLGIKSDRIKNN